MEILSIADSRPISNNTEALRVNELIPSYLKENAQDLIDFIADYYDYLNQQNNPSFLIDQIIANQDVDNTTDVFIKNIKAEIAKNVPNSKVLNDKELLRKIAQFWKIKGSEMSVPTFFRIFYDEIVSVSYPKEHLFKLSAGNWKQRNFVEDSILRGNYIGGSVPLSNSLIGSYFNILDLYGQNIGNAQLSSFTSIDETFDVTLHDEGLQLRYDAHDATSVSSTEWLDKIQNVALARNNNIEYNENDNIFDLDGIDDSLSATSLGANVSLSSTFHTVIARFGREDNTTGDKNQSIFHLGNPNSPYQGLELYVDRVSGAIGKRLNGFEKPVIVRRQIDEIELKHFDPYEQLDGVYYRMLTSLNGREVYCKQPYNVTLNPLTVNDDFVRYDGSNWVILKNDSVLYESFDTDVLDPSSSALSWTWKIPSGVDGEFSVREKKNIILYDKYLFHKISQYAVVLYIKEQNVWSWQDVIYDNSIINNFDFDTVEKRLYLANKYNSQVNVYQLNEWDMFQKLDPITGLNNTEFVTAENGRIIVDSQELSSSNYASVTSLDTNKIAGFSELIGDNLVCFTNNGLSINDKKIGCPYDNSNNDIAFTINDAYAIIGKGSELSVYEESTDGFWSTNTNYDADVSITIVSHDDGIQEKIEWGPAWTNYNTSSSGIVLTKTFTSSETDNSNYITNWQEKTKITDVNSISKVILQGSSLFVSDKNAKELKVYETTGFTLTNTLTKQLAEYSNDFQTDGDNLYLLYQDNLDKINYRQISNLATDYDIEPSFRNTPIDINEYVQYTDNIAVPVIQERPKYYTVALQGFRDRNEGYIKLSVDGGNWETILQGDTWNHLNITDSSSLTIGQNGSNADYFSGIFTHLYYYDNIVSLSNINIIKEYIEAESNNWFMLQFSNLEGTLVGVDRIEEITTTGFIFDSLSGYEVDSFWQLGSNPEAGGYVSIEVTYGDTITKSQRVSWGDSTSQAFVKQSNGNKLRHSFVGPITGKYLDKKGWPSNNSSKLHDGEYYQEFSYVINPSISPKDWENEFLALVHPAGLKYISALLLLLPRTTDWVGPNITFDSTTKKYVWNRPGDNFISPYETKRPKWDLDWQKGLVPSYITGDSDGYHSPIFQPGWLEDIQTMILTIGGELYPQGINEEQLVRLNKLVRRLLLQDLTPSRDERARNDYKQNLKFKDHEDISDYLYIPISEAIEDYSETDNIIKFSNFPSIINK